MVKPGSGDGSSIGSVGVFFQFVPVNIILIPRPAPDSRLRILDRFWVMDDHGPFRSGSGNRNIIVSQFNAFDIAPFGVVIHSADLFIGS